MGPPKQRLPLGQSDFRALREQGYAYVDKTALIDTNAGERPTTALAGALEQIREREYVTELVERGASPCIEMAAVFDGKRAWVAKAEGSPPPSRSDSGPHP